jgi:hypothetical protein
MDAKNGYRIDQKQDVGSQLGSIGSLAVNGQNIHVQGSGLGSQQGITQLTAADNIIGTLCNFFECIQKIGSLLSLHLNLVNVKTHCY